MYMTDFVRNFNSKSEADVMWLKEIGQATVKTMDGTKVDIVSIINKNPIKGKPKMDKPLDWRMYTFSYA